MNPYLSYVSRFSRALDEGASIPCGGWMDAAPRAPAPDAPKALLLSPHPDDECITGALPLRLQREHRWRIVNVAVTLGSFQARRSERWRELQRACGSLGWDLVATGDQGLERINAATRKEDPVHWAAAVAVIAALIEAHRPAAIFFPHAGDWNSTHTGTHWLAMDALSRVAPSFACAVVETEFWAPMTSPNLMIESSVQDVADLVAALSCHEGEVRRNPYHLRLPAWMMDNVRRGGELLGGQGGPPPQFEFATLYRLSRWSGGRIAGGLGSGMIVGRREPLDTLFAPRT